MRLKLRRIFDILYKVEDGPSGPPSLCLHRADGGQNFFREGYNQPAEDAENALGPLAGIVGLDAHAKLDDAPAQDDHAHGLDAGENKIRKVVDDGKRVAASGQGGNGKGGAEDQEHDGAPIEAAGAAVSPELLAGKRVAGITEHERIELFHDKQTSHSMISMLSRPSKGRDRSFCVKESPGR